MTSLHVVFFVSLGWVVFTYIGHPLVLAILSRTHGNPWQIGDETPSVSICVAAFNEADVIAEKISNLLDLQYDKPIQIVVADDGSSDSTASTARANLGDAGTIISSKNNIGKTAMQNLAMKSLCGEIVIFSDATSSWPSDLVYKLVRHFKDPTVACVAADVAFKQESGTNVSDGQSAYWRYERRLRIHGAQIWTNIVVSGTCYAVRRCQLSDNPPSVAEDLGTPLRIALSGNRVVFDPEALVAEVGATTKPQESRMRRRVALQNITAIFHFSPKLFGSNAFAVYQFFAHKFMRAFSWVALLVILLSSTLLAQSSLPFQLLVLIQLLFYGLAMFATFYRTEVRAPALTVPYYFTLLNLNYGLAIIDYIRGVRSTRWKTSNLE